MSRTRRRNKWSWRRVISVTLAVLLICGVIAGVVSLTSHITTRVSDDKKTISPTFARGGIEVKTGVSYQTNGVLYTPEAFSAKGLEIKLDFDALVSYRVFFYDALDNFIWCSESYTGGSTHYAPANAKVRIEMTPLWDKMADVDTEEIAWYEVWDYANRIEIRVDKNQKVSRSEYVETTLDSDIFTKNVDSYFDPGQSSMSWIDYDGCEFYIFANDDGEYSSMYLDTVSGESIQNLEIVVTLHDDQTIHYYYSGDQVFTNGAAMGDLPTYEDPLAIPPGASVYIVFDGNVVSAQDLLVYFY